MSQEVAHLDDIISFGRIAAQNAGKGDPIFPALENAEAVKAYAKGLVPFFSLDVEAPASLVEMVDDAESRVYDAAANIRTDPDRPLPSTIWERVKAAPWPIIAGGVGLLMLGGVWWNERHRRARA